MAGNWTCVLCIHAICRESFYWDKSGFTFSLLDGLAVAELVCDRMYNAHKTRNSCQKSTKSCRKGSSGPSWEVNTEVNPERAAGASLFCSGIGVICKIIPFLRSFTTCITQIVNSDKRSSRGFRFTWIRAAACIHENLRKNGKIPHKTPFLLQIDLFQPQIGVFEYSDNPTRSSRSFRPSTSRPSALTRYIRPTNLAAIPVDKARAK